MSQQKKHFYEFGPFRVDATEQVLLRDGHIVPLSPAVFDLLLALVENSGHLLDKDELMQKLWPDSFVEENNLARNVSRLRTALGESHDEHPYIETVPRRGYRFVADVQEVQDGDDLIVEERARSRITIRENQGAIIPQVPLRRRSAKTWLWAMTLPVLALLVGLGLLVYSRATDATPPAIKSLAVLPLENLSGDPSQEYFADGMTEALISSLAQIRALRVVSRTSVMRFKGSKPPLPEIARDLNVDAVIEGSVQRADGRVKISIQLIHGPTDTHLWARDYERELTDILQLQGEVARAVGEEVRIQVTAEEQAQLGSPRPVNPEAYDYYLRGRFYANRQNKDENETTIMTLERAVALDPAFAAAHAELSQAYVWKLFLFAPGERQWEEKAFMAAEKALSLDPNLAVAYLARGRLLWTPANHFPHEKAIREYRRALALNPDLDEARNQLALIYCHIGAFDEALQESQKAVTINPSNNLALYRTGQTLNFQGKYEQGLSVLRSLPKEVNPPLVGYQTAWALFNLGRKAEAAALVEQFLRDYPEDSGGLFTSVQAVFAASAGQERRAEGKIKLAVERGKGFGHFHHTAYNIACASALMNKSGQAIKWLQTAAEDGFPCYPLFERDANLDNLRQDARFVTFMANLRQQWEYYRTIF